MDKLILFFDSTLLNNLFISYLFNIPLNYKSGFSVSVLDGKFWKKDEFFWFSYFNYIFSTDWSNKD